MTTAATASVTAATGPEAVFDRAQLEDRRFAVRHFCRLIGLSDFRI